jgi:thiol:disulfide interchange protein DsbD
MTALTLNWQPEEKLKLKFLSSFDLVYHTGLLSREVFLVLWIVIFAFLGMYLLGKIKLSHDTALTHVSVPRLFFSLFSFAFALYLVPGLWGAPLTAISGLAPPLSSQEFILRSGSAPAEEVARLPANRKYATLFQEPDGLEGFYDYKEAQMYARKVNKPLFIDFTGHSCVNCRKMEQTIWSDPRVRQRLNNNFILVSLYVDEKKELPVSEQYTSKVFGNRVVSVGNLNSDLQATRFNTNSQPFYVVADKDGNALVKPSQYDADVDNYIAFLDKGLQAYKQKYK